MQHTLAVQYRCAAGCFTPTYQQPGALTLRISDRPANSGADSVMKATRTWLIGLGHISHSLPFESFWIILEGSHTLRYSCLATTQLANLQKKNQPMITSAQSEAELACIWCLSSDIQTGAAQKSSSWDFISSASSVKLGFDSTCLATMLGSRKKSTERVVRSCAKRIVQLMLPKPSKITHNFHLTRRAMWHGHLALNQKQNWLVSGAYLQTVRLERHRNHHLETSYQVHLLSSLVSNSTRLATMLRSRKTHRTCSPVMCQKNRATHATQAIKNNAQLPSDKMCSAAWTSSSQSEAELACIWCLSSDTFRLERHRNHHLETSYQVHLLSSLVSILPALQPCCVQGKTHRACCPAPLPSDKTCYVAWTSNAQSEAELALSGAYLQTFRLERHRNHHLETSYQVHLLSSSVSILPALQPCWVQGKTHRACWPVMCQKNQK